MEKKNPLIRCLVLIAFIVCCTACAGTPVRESTGEFIDDSVITTKIKSQLAADSFLKIFQISVETFRGTVQLSGFVNSQRDINRAEEIARSVGGVRSVRNHLIIK